MKILQKYGLGETTDEVIKKIYSNQISSSAIIAFVVKKMAIGEINASEAIEKIKNDLTLPLKKAEEIVNELESQVVPLGKERGSVFEKKQNEEIEKAEVLKKPPPKKESLSNIYREPIE
ncbi:hypothetical protein L6252_00290 [Candidatus Parcubacteria bacterium]|nr:hypothetical protein [Candidatus Parcubacteria bacterium]